MPEKNVNFIHDHTRSVGDAAAVQEVMQAQMAEVVPMLSAEAGRFSAWLPEYVERRSADLSAKTTITNFGVEQKDTGDFLGPEVDVNMGIMYRPYHLNDNKAHEAAFGFLREEYGRIIKELPPDRAYLNAAILAANKGQAAYFKSIIGNHMGRSLLAGDFLEDDAPASNSIADFKNVAMCLERAVVAHNILKILGIDSRLLAGTIAVRQQDGEIEQEAHAFITVSGSKDSDRYIFDPTNPVAFKNAKGNIVGIKPALYTLTSPDARQSTGNLREFWEQPDGKYALSLTREVTYTLPETRPQ